MRSIVLAAVIALALPVVPEQGRLSATAAGEPQARGTARGQAAARQRFREMDQNGDGTISRAEWRGTVASFRVHDWNRDGVLSGAELNEAVREAAANTPEDFESPVVFNDWSAARFNNLDRNRDGRLTRAEWIYDLETFRRIDRNRDGIVARAEFVGGGDFDDDRGDRFDFLDADGNNRVTRQEWHASQEAFTWLDTNRDGVLSRLEVEGEGADQQGDVFTRLDTNRNNRINPTEWQWSRQSFDRLDVNNDGVLTRAEMAGRQKAGSDTATLAISPTGAQRWIDTGLYVEAGDRVRFQATGTIQMSTNGDDIADPAGARSRRRANDAPMPEQLAGGLIARIESGRPVFVGGRTAPIISGDTGRLFLSVNDDHLDDNKGQYQVTVTVQRRTP
jgi:Ca2+-binding EF-hand superfamily protein